ncbi:MAG TPA: polyprenol monophosphomannose synthase [Acidimicrobiales bacterium]|nr:polyprenol monophosphomannose synthase [Acidimicrobiales bacterium]
MVEATPPRAALVVVPTFNEAATIGEVIERLQAADPSLHVLVVDDGSPDGTADLVERIGADRPGVFVLRRRAKEGLGQAYLAGFRWGLEHGYGAMVEMDADLSHDPGAAPGLVAALSGADLVIGSRYVPGGSIPSWSPHRRAISTLGNRYSSWMLGLPVRDLTSGFRAYRGELLGRLPLDEVRAGGYGFQIEMAYRTARAGGRIVEVPIRFVDRVEGESKMSMRITLEALVLVTAWGVRRRVGRRGVPARR